MKLFTVVFLFLVGCGGGGGSDDSSYSKPLLSKWTPEVPGVTFDITGVTMFLNTPINFVFVGGEKCQCTMTIGGSETNGSYFLSFCAYNSGGAGDPGCASLNQSGTYHKDAARLSLCVGTNCNYYR